LTARQPDWRRKPHQRRQAVRHARQGRSQQPTRLLRPRRHTGSGHRDSAIWPTASLLFMRAVGRGVKTNVAQAYRYLMQHWRTGDSVYVFGFSRGAFTARALAGMLWRPGLARPGSENLLPYAVEKCPTNRDFKPDEYAEWDEFARAFCWRTDGEPGVRNRPTEQPRSACTERVADRLSRVNHHS
jgi:hypothetical protein